MAFERLEVRAASGKKGMPASMSLSCHGGSTRPAAIVALSAALVGEAGYSAKSKFNIFIGTDDDAGRLRIVAEKDGIIEPRQLKAGAFFLNLGYVPLIGVEPCKKKPTEATVVAPGTVELIIPDFSEGAPKRLAPPPAAKNSAPPAPAKKSPGEAGETFKGVTIDLTEDSETVAFKGKSIEVTTRQAKMVRLLARPRPTPVAESFLIAALWDGKPPQTAGEQLRQIAADLQKALSPIGLDLRTVKGVGYQLKDR